MKLLLIFPIIFLLSGCFSGQSDEEKARIEKEKHVNEVLDQSMEVFETNKNFLLAEIIFGTLCQEHFMKSGSNDSPDCDTYDIAQDLAGEVTDDGILILIGLFKEGYLTVDSPRYPEFVNVIEQLIVLTEEAYNIKKDMESYEGTNCEKCLM